MQQYHNNHFQDCLLSPTISNRLEQETRDWSQIQGLKKILPDLIFYPTYQETKSIANEQKGSDMQKYHNSNFQDCLLSTTISKRFQLETCGWSHIKGVKKIFPYPPIFLQSTYQKTKCIANKQKGSEMQIHHNNHFWD